MQEVYLKDFTAFEDALAIALDVPAKAQSDLLR